MDLVVMYDYAHSYGKIHVCITHGPQDLALFYVQNLYFYGSRDEVKSRRKTCIKDAGNMSVEELVSWVEEEAAIASKACDYDISVTSVVDKGKWLADKGKGLVDKGKEKMVDEGNAGRKSTRSRNSGIVIEENVNPTFSEDDDSDSDIDMVQRFKGSADLEEMYKGITDYESEYSDKSIHYLSEGEGEDELISLRKRNIKAKKILIQVGEKYVDADQLKECLTYHSLANGFSLWFYRSSQDQVISLNEEHTCVENFKYGTLVNYKWIGKYFRLKIRQNPQIKLHEIADLDMKKYKCIVIPNQCRNAKKFALNEGETTTEEHYAMIMSYGKEILDSNDGSTFKPEIVNVENKDIWSCFLQLLGEDIDMPIGNELTLISDQHKGLIEAVKDVMPLAEHRQCARHIYEGFRKQYSGVQFKELFWAASKAGFGMSVCLADGTSLRFRKGSEAFKYMRSEKPDMQNVATCRKDAYYKAYHQYLTPIGGMAFCPDSSMYSIFLPPKPRKMPDRPRKQRIRALHERKFPNRVSRADVEMTCQNCFEKGHNTASCTKPTVILPKKQPTNRGRPKKNVENVESGGDATFNMGLVGVKTGTNVGSVGDKTGINVGSVGDETSKNVGSVGVESSAGNEIVRSASLGDFVSVNSEGTTTTTRSRGRLGFEVRRGTSEDTPAAIREGGGQTLGLGVRRGTSGSTSTARRSNGGQTLGLRFRRGIGFRKGVAQGVIYGRLGRWFGLGDETQPNEQPTLVTQQSQAGIQQEPQAD
ncbi:pentatricopeptide repeat-containing protein [Tanacetum coccineum]